MLAQGKIKLEEANRARRSPIVVSRKVCEAQASTIAPYFIVMSSRNSSTSWENAREGNFIIQTQLDPQMQAQAEAALRKLCHQCWIKVAFPRCSYLDSGTGAVLALTGGTDYKTSQFNRATQAYRQPGSTFKIFTYTAAIEQASHREILFLCAADLARPTIGAVNALVEVDMYTGIALHPSLSKSGLIM